MSALIRSFGGRTASAETFPQLKTLLERIRSACSPVDVILYGSQATGEATAQSDWDLKVIVPDESAETLFSPLFGWRIQEGSGVYADISCVRVSDFQADLRIANSAASHIVNDGIVLNVG